MMIRLTVATGLMLAALSPRLAIAADNTLKKAEKETIRLAGKCEKEALKDQRDADRGRKHAQRDNKWDLLCAPPPPPVLPPPPPVEDLDPVVTEPPPGQTLPPSM